MIGFYCIISLSIELGIKKSMRQVGQTQKGNGKSMKVAKVKKKRKSFFVRIFLFALSLYAVVSVVQMQVDIAKAKETLANEKSQRQMAELKNEDLKERLAVGVGEDDIVRFAREMGYVYPDEQVVRSANGD